MIRNSPKFILKTLNLSQTQWLKTLPVRCLSTEGKQLVNVVINDKTGFATVTLNRKPVNGLSLELVEELSKTLDDLESNKTRGAILTSVRNTVFVVCYLQKKC